MTRLLVLGDSVPAGERTDGPGWPARLADTLEGAVDVTVRAAMGKSLAALAEEPVGLAARSEETAVVVHAGHNDAQLRDGAPRVPPDAFAAAAARLDRTLSGEPVVSRHAFLGLVPLLPLEASGAVPFSDAQPDRSLAYDDRLATAVESGAHLPVARPVADWHARTEDGVHPNAAGHAFLAERVRAWLAGEN